VAYAVATEQRHYDQSDKPIRRSTVKHIQRYSWWGFLLNCYYKDRSFL